MLRISDTIWISKDKIAVVYVSKGNLYVEYTSETLKIEKDYVQDFCGALNLPHSEIVRRLA